MSLPCLLTRIDKLLFHFSVRPAVDLNFFRIILLSFDITDFMGTRITSTIFTRHTFCDWHFAVTQKDYRTVDGFVYMLQQGRLTAINCHSRTAVSLLPLLLRIHTNFHVISTRITIIVHINFTMQTINMTFIIERRILDWIRTTVWPIFAATRCTTVSNENINFTCNCMFKSFCAWKLNV